MRSLVFVTDILDFRFHFGCHLLSSICQEASLQTNDELWEGADVSMMDSFSHVLCCQLSSDKHNTLKGLGSKIVQKRAAITSHPPSKHSCWALNTSKVVGLLTVQTRLTPQHLLNQWTPPLPPSDSLDKQVTTSLINNPMQTWTHYLTQTFRFQF